MLVKNRSWSPRILTLKGGSKTEPRTLALHGRGSAEIGEDEFQSPECQRLIARGELFVIPDAGADAGSATPKSKKTRKKGAEADA